MASVRPLIASALPRQGVPPAYAGFRELAGELSWGLRAQRLHSVREWWWELRLHPELGTLEIRVPDAQSRVEDAAALVAVAATLALWLAARHRAGDLPAPAPGWRIEENRWSAARHGVHGRMADLDTGRTSWTGERLHELLETLAEHAREIGAEPHLARAHALAESNGADAQRRLAAELGAERLVDHLCDAFLDPPPSHRDGRSPDGVRLRLIPGGHPLLVADKLTLLPRGDERRAREIVVEFAERTGLTPEVLPGGGASFSLAGEDHRIEVVQTLTEIDPSWSECVALGAPEAA
jgi:hypothetical protein